MKPQLQTNPAQVEAPSRAEPGEGASLPSPRSRATHKTGPDKVLDAFSSTHGEISEIGCHAHSCPQTPILKVSFKNASGSVFWSAHPQIQHF